MDVISLVAMPTDIGKRIDHFVPAQLGEMTRNAVQRLCEEGHVTVNGLSLSKNYRMKAGDRVEIIIPPPKQAEPLPQNIPLNILYEDGDLLVVEKPKGMVVHPAAGNDEGTLVNALLYHCGDSLSGVGGVVRPGIVHRIDKDTSGLLVVAKNDRTHRALSDLMRVHDFKRQYHAVVYGRVKEESGTVRAPIGRHPVDRKRMCVTERNSRDAATHYRVQEYLDGFTYLLLELETGRTHQIRVHMAHIGHPVAGDPVYGPKKVITSLAGQCLHAGLLGFVHPTSGAYVEFESPLPPYFVDFLRQHKTI
jgi:23S rRNA pseudouridine1911/1915/1917 synthase